MRERALHALNLEQYKEYNTPLFVDAVDINVPKERQYILRMLIKKPFTEYRLPESLSWCKKLIDKAEKHQHKELGINHPFCYLTIRNGMVNSVTDDEWHVDGFSMKITHLPEHNYVWVNKHPTEYVVKGIEFPHDFDPLKHNIHKYISSQINENDEIKTIGTKLLWCMDPYIIHRRPPGIEGISRCFVRISFTPIEIFDKNNTENPLLETNYKRDGVKEFREKLIDYNKEA